MDAQIYCTVQDLLSALGKSTGESRMVFQRIKDASRFIAGKFGRFLPFYETYTLHGVSTETLMLKIPVLDLLEVRIDGVAVTDYTAHPEERCWPNGPYTWLERESGWGKTVEIDGVWGMYNELEPLGVTITSQNLTDITLTLPYGNILSPGTVIRIDDEQELVVSGNGGPNSPAASLATSLLSAALTADAVEVSVDSGAEFFEEEVIQIGVEDMLIKRIGGNVLLVERSYNSTSRAEHADNSPIRVFRTYRVARGVNGTSASAHTSATLQRYNLPDDVNYLALQIASLMQSKAETGFTGRAGSTENGDTFYINEFPRQIADIRANYSIPYL